MFNHFTFIIFVTLSTALSAVAGTIQNYEVHHADCAYKQPDKQPDTQSEKRTLLRSFEMDGHTWGFVVNPATLETEIVSELTLDCGAKKPSSKSRYESILNEAVSAPYLNSNDGLISDSNKNVYLTIDLCPSDKKFEPELLQFLKEASAKLGYTLPLGIAVSGNWMTQHKGELAELISLEKSGAIEITWINHTRHHPYDRTLPNQHNFLLKANVSPKAELLEQEILMIQSGLIPSVFMRFPGLISNQEVMELMNTFGLIPLGANAWIAKTRSFKPGDIILIHGNGNEPAGVDLLLKFIRDKESKVPWTMLLHWNQ